MHSLPKAGQSNSTYKIPFSYRIFSKPLACFEDVDKSTWTLLCGSFFHMFLTIVDRITRSGLISQTSGRWTLCLTKCTYQESAFGLRSLDWSWKPVQVLNVWHNSKPHTDFQVPHLRMEPKLTSCLVYPRDKMKCSPVEFVYRKSLWIVYRYREISSQVPI